MVPRRAHLFTFYSKVGIPHFAAAKISFCIKYSLCYPSCALFFCPIVCSYYLEWCPIERSCLLFIQRLVYLILLLKNFFLYKIFFVLPIVCTFFCPIVCSYYFEWCPIERACLLFTQKLVYLILLQINFFLYKIFFVLPIVCTYFLPHRVQ